MNKKLVQLLESLTPEEQLELENFVAFLVARRGKKLELLSDDVSADELAQLVSDAGVFDWLESSEEDVYSLEDGRTVQWPNSR